MQKFFTSLTRIALLGLGVFTLASAGNLAQAGTVLYDSYPTQFNGVPMVNDGTPGYPNAGPYLGNTITFDATAWAANSLLTDVKLALINESGNSADPFTVNIYSGTDPNNTGTLLASTTQIVGHSPGDVDFSFNVVVPQTITFTVGAGSVGTGVGANYAGLFNSNGGPAVGSGPNSLWYGNGSTYVANASWAIADGANTNYLGAEFFATAVPEPSTLVIWSLLASVFGVGGIRKRILSRSESRL